MDFTRLGVAFYNEMSHECTHSQLYNVHHAWYVVIQCRPIDSGVLMGWQQLGSYLVISGSIISHNSYDMAIGMLNTIESFLLLYG